MNVEELEKLFRPPEEVVYMDKLKPGDKFKFIRGCAIGSWADRNVLYHQVTKNEHDTDDEYGNTLSFKTYKTNNDEISVGDWSYMCCTSRGKQSCCYVLKIG